MGFITPDYEDMELSTQILISEALKRNIEVEVLDRGDNFISLRQNGRTEYVKQATRTSTDKYISSLIMENKLVTKKILTQHGIHVPAGQMYTEAKAAVKDFDDYCGRSIVIKPKSTNFGIGISIHKELGSEDIFNKAVYNSFEYDSSILIESFIPGKEYRFLVIDDAVIAVLHRIPANVTGDGILTIEELVAEKNSDPLRGTGYRTPLEKLKTGKEETEFLNTQGLTISSIPPNGEQVFLRKNSNISTGGDSIDYTDKIPESYKQIAIKSAKAVGAKICGVDMIIMDIDQELSSGANGHYNYGIIELNFNPALHIHEFPYKGQRRFSEKKILELLGF